MDAAVEIDHYAILGLPSGEEGAKLSKDEIKKAYRAKALISHPDKNPNDPLAHSTFQKLKTSYEILSDATARAAFDALLAAKLDRLRHHARLDSKRRRMMDDLDQRERASEASPVDPSELDRRKEEAAAKKFQQEVARIREMYAKKMAAGTKKGDDRDTAVGANAEAGNELDKEKILKVSWEREGEDYSAARLKEVFGRFGEVEDVVIRAKGSKKRRSALIVMKSKAAAVSATRNMCGDLSNPLLVLPLHSNAADLPSASPAKYAEPETPNLGNLVGAGYQAYEDSILKKLQKAAEKQKS
ncbi:dnaJ subfamily C member 17-like protein [Cinnamomum micranthum f. kanehirae]|uniref:DnaJ subfamily C member 17-like protein n=1 Tax=Cinnamomum micranthum f. kanehirae TaxID=337451 RepID=A0A3S3QG16_9MAGN|nr:dnaJ subfamily C member 17-like protein [Cinnamomum micranthum f. kanehirae]